MAIILQTKIDFVPPNPETGLYSNQQYLAGYAILASGLTTGWANLACGCALDPLPASPIPGPGTSQSSAPLGHASAVRFPSEGVHSVLRSDR